MSLIKNSGAKKQRHSNVLNKIRPQPQEGEDQLQAEIQKSPIDEVEKGSFGVFKQLVKPYQGLFWADIITYTVATILFGLLPLLIGMVIDSVQIDFDAGRIEMSQDTYRLLAIFLGVAAFNVALYRVNALILAYFEPKFRASARARLTEYTLSRSVSFLSDKFAGRLAHAINEMARAAQAVIDHIRWSMIEPFLITLMLVGTALTVHPYYSVLLIVWLLFFVGGIAAMTIGLQKMVTEVADRRGHGSAMITDTVMNFLTVKMFASKKYEMKLLCESLDSEVASGKKFLMYVFGIKCYQGVLEIILFVASAVMIWLLWKDNNITVGQISLIFSTCIMVTDYLWSFSSQLISFTEDTGSFSESLGQIHEDKKRAVELSQVENYKPEKGEIVFNNLSFAYNVDDAPLFKGFQLHIKAGERVGVVGRSGSGKSTLVKLLLRFYDVGDEEIVIDRQNVSKLDQDSVRQNIAVIPQDANLFNRSVLENIRYGRLDATDEEVYEAAKLAYAHDFIEKLPQGYDTPLGDRGTKLSGGQRQRVAIARAILKDAPILVLDEATSALDSESEAAIQKALEKVMEGRTVVAIAHRLSTISDMDRILVLEDGEIIEDGSHDELLKKNGRYAELWAMQSGGFVE